MSKAAQRKTKSRHNLPAETNMTELVPAEWGLVSGGITREVQTSLSAGTTGGAAKGTDWDSLWSFTTLATTPSCAIVIAVTLS